MNPKILSISFFLVLLIHTAKATVNVVPLNQWCLPAGNGMIEPVSVTSGTDSNQIPPYDYVSFYPNAKNESTQLLINMQAAGVEDWKAFWVDKSGKWTMVTLVGTKFHSYLNLVNNYLFTLSGQNYYVYKINETDTSVNGNSFTFDRPLTGGFVRFLPYSVDHANNLIFALYEDTNEHKIITYQWIKDQTLNSLSNTTAVSMHESLVGNGNFLLDAASQNFLTWTGTQWSTILVVSDPANSVLKTFQLKDQILVTTVTKPSTKTGEVGILGLSPSSLINVTVSQTPSTNEIQYFSDDLFNFVRVTSNELFWLTITSTKDNYRTSISSAELPELTSILTVGMSQNKASVYYSSGKFEFYRHLGNSTVERFYSRAVRPTSLIDLTTSKNYQVNFNCSCHNINQMGCSSQSLYCVHVNRPASMCKGSGDGSTKW